MAGLAPVKLRQDGGANLKTCDFASFLWRHGNGGACPSYALRGNLEAINRSALYRSNSTRTVICTRCTANVKTIRDGVPRSCSGIDDSGACALPGWRSKGLLDYRWIS